MSNEIELVSVDSEKQTKGLYDSDSYRPLLEAVNAIPTLWMFLYREADLRYVDLFNDDDEYSLLIARKTKALKQLREAARAVASVSKADLTEHAKYFEEYLSPPQTNSSPCPDRWNG